MGVKISELTELEDAKISDMIPIVDMNNNGTKKITKGNLLKNKITKITTEDIITQNTDYTVPTYIVGNNSLLIFYEGCKLIKEENYIEVGTEGQESTTIQFKDWDVPKGSNLEIIYK